MAPRPFVVDPTLTAIAIGYRNTAQMLIADQVLPRVPVGQETFKYTKYPLSEAFNITDNRVGRRGRVNEVEFSGEEAESSVEDYGLDSPIPNSDIEAAAKAREEKRSTFDPEAHATMMLEQYNQLNRERRVAALVHDPATYSAGRKITLAGASQLSDYANSDPIGVIKAALEGTLVFRPNKVVMGQAVWSKLSGHAKLVEAVRGTTDKGLITRAQFADLFELPADAILVGEGFVNTARPGQNVTLGRVWGKHIAFLYIDPLASTQGGVTFGFTAQLGTKVAGRIEDPHIGLQGGQRIRAGERVRELVVAPDCGYLVQNAVA